MCCSLELSSQQQHFGLNKLLNLTTEESGNPPHNPADPHAQRPWPIRYKRERQKDLFYQYPDNKRGGKCRVSRDLATGEIIGIVRKKRLGDMNIANSCEMFDMRVSVNVEEPRAC